MTTTNSFSYEDALHELQQILQDLQGPPGDLSEMEVRVTRARDLIHQCRAHLLQVGERIDQLWDEPPAGDRDQ